jgi:hypothetical protein
VTDLRPLLDPDRYTDEELALSEQGLCSEVVADYPSIQRCAEPSSPDSPYRFCAHHDEQAREDNPDSWHRDDIETSAAMWS